MQNKKETHPGSKYFYRISEEQSHLGGNIIGGDPCTTTSRLWNWLKDKYSPVTLLDIGAGEGHATKYFIGLGIQAEGIDGLKDNIDNAVAPISLHDLTKGPFLHDEVDMVWCCELVEHIEEKYLNNLLDTLGLGKLIVMTHASPGQEGLHHVNCQTDNYWIKKLKDKGYELLIEDTKFARKIAFPDDPNFKLSWFSVSGLIFKRIRYII